VEGGRDVGGWVSGRASAPAARRVGGWVGGRGCHKKTNKC